MAYSGRFRLAVLSLATIASVAAYAADVFRSIVTGTGSLFADLVVAIFAPLARLVQVDARTVLAFAGNVFRRELEPVAPRMRFASFISRARSHTLFSGGGFLPIGVHLAGANCY